MVIQEATMVHSSMVSMPPFNKSARQGSRNSRPDKQSEVPVVLSPNIHLDSMKIHEAADFSLQDVPDIQVFQICLHK